MRSEAVDPAEVLPRSRESEQGPLEVNASTKCESIYSRGDDSHLGGEWWRVWQVRGGVLQAECRTEGPAARRSRLRSGAAGTGLPSQVMGMFQVPHSNQNLLWRRRPSCEAGHNTI